MGRGEVAAPGVELLDRAGRAAGWFAGGPWAAHDTRPALWSKPGDANLAEDLREALEVRGIDMEGHASMPRTATWPMGWAFVTLILAASCSNVEPQDLGTLMDGPQLRLDLRPLEERRTSEIEEMPLDSVHPDTSADGFPGWLSTLPDSMKAIVGPEDREVVVFIHVDKGAGGMDVSVDGPKGLVTRTTVKEPARSPVAWRWDLRDSSCRRVPPGLYEVFVGNRVGARIGYMLVK